MDSASVTLPSGDKMPIIGLGTWQSKPGEVQAAVEYSLKIGYRHIDCAAIYGNENEVGAGLKDAIDKGYVKRRDVFIVSKLWNSCHDPADIEPACRKTLKDLGLDYLDLYLIHWPTSFQRGPETFPRDANGDLLYANYHPTQTWLQLEKLVEKKLVRNIGLSNFNSQQIQDILDKGTIKPATNQVECHPYLNQSKLLKFCMDRGIHLTAYSPLGSPTRPWAKPDEPKLLERPELLDIAKRLGKTLPQVLLRYQIQRRVIVIPKSVTPSRIEENFKVFDFVLSEEDMKLIDSFDCNGRVVVPMKDGEFRDKDHPHFPFNLEF